MCLTAFLLDIHIENAHGYPSRMQHCVCHLPLVLCNHSATNVLSRIECELACLQVRDTGIASQDSTLLPGSVCCGRGRPGLGCVPARLCTPVQVS